MIDVQTITNLITAFKAEVEKDSISPERLGGLLQQITDKIGTALAAGDLSSLETAALSNAFSGTINITKAAAASTLKTAYNNLPVNRMQFYIITDSNGLFVGDKVTAHADVANLFNKDSLGASVGDLLVLGKYNMLVNIAVYRIIPLNDAKLASGSFPGADGLETVWDKTQVNKVPAMETNMGLLNRGNSFKYFTADNYNIDQCLDCGVYLYGRTGRSMPGNHSDEYYIIDVATRYNINDSKFYITQKVYSVNYPNRTFIRFIVTDSVTNYNGTYGDWIQIGSETFYLADLGDMTSVKGGNFVTEIRNRITAIFGKVVFGNYTFSMQNCSTQSLNVSNCGTKVTYIVTGSLLTENLNTLLKTVGNSTSTTKTIVMYNGTMWVNYSLPPLEYKWADFEDWVLDDTITADELPKYPMNTIKATDVFEMGWSIYSKLMKIAKDMEPIDVTPLFTEGGTLTTTAARLRNNHLYFNDSKSFFSTVTVSVSDRVWYMDAYRVYINASGDYVKYLYRAVVKTNEDNTVFTTEKVYHTQVV